MSWGLHLYTTFTIPHAELTAADIEPQHCVAKYVEGKVFLTPLTGTTQVNEQCIEDETKLTHGKVVSRLAKCIYSCAALQYCLPKYSGVNIMPQILQVVPAHILFIFFPLFAAHYVLCVD